MTWYMDPKIHAGISDIMDEPKWRRYGAGWKILVRIASTFEQLGILDGYTMVTPSFVFRWDDELPNNMDVRRRSNGK